MEHLVLRLEGGSMLHLSLQLTPEQKHKIISSRGGVLRQQNNIADVMEIVDAVQKKVTPRRKPRKKGGSPSGVKEPAILATMKMKKM